MKKTNRFRALNKNCYVVRGLISNFENISIDLGYNVYKWKKSIYF